MGTALDIRPIDPADETRLRRYHEIGWRAEREDGRPWNASFWTYPELAAEMQQPTLEMSACGYAAWADDRMVGFGLCELPLLDNTDKAYLMVAVEPELRGRGIGGAVLDELVARAREAGRTEALCESALPYAERDRSPVLDFAREHGFVPANTEIYRILPLPTAPGRLTALAEEAAAHHRGVVIETYVDVLPEEYLPSYVGLLNQLALDAPTGDIEFEAEAMTPEIAAAKMERALGTGRRTYRTVAVLDGEVVAHSDLFVMPGSAHAQQMGTLVHRDQRGRRLGTSVKVANLAALLADRPAVTEVHTQNAEDNRWMVDINVRLGFAPVGACVEFSRAC